MLLIVAVVGLLCHRRRLLLADVQHFAKEPSLGDTITIKNKSNCAAYRQVLLATPQRWQVTNNKWQVGGPAGGISW